MNGTEIKEMEGSPDLPFVYVSNCAPTTLREGLTKFKAGTQLRFFRGDIEIIEKIFKPKEWSICAKNTSLENFEIGKEVDVIIGDPLKGKLTPLGIVNLRENENEKNNYFVEFQVGNENAYYYCWISRFGSKSEVDFLEII